MAGRPSTGTGLWTRTRLQPDPHTTLSWLKVTTPSIEGTTAEWLVLDGDSHLLGTVELPKSIRLRVIRGDRAYGEDRGEVTTLVVYEVQE